MKDLRYDCDTVPDKSEYAASAVPWQGRGPCQPAGGRAAEVHPLGHHAAALRSGHHGHRTGNTLSRSIMVSK